MVYPFRNLIQQYDTQGMVNEEAVFDYCGELHINPDEPTDAAKEFVLDAIAYAHLYIGKLSCGYRDKVQRAVKQAVFNWTSHGYTCTADMERDAADWVAAYFEWHINNA